MLEKDRSKLTKNKNQMAADLERLLNQKEVSSVYREMMWSATFSQVSHVIMDYFTN